MSRRKTLLATIICLFIGFVLIVGCEWSLENSAVFSESNSGFPVSELSESNIFLYYLNNYDNHVSYIENRLARESKKYNWTAGATVSLNALALDMDAAGDNLTSEDYNALGQEVLNRLEAVLVRTEQILVKIKQEINSGKINYSEKVIYDKVIPRLENAINILNKIIQAFKDNLGYHILISDYGSTRVIEIDLTGSIVWNTADFGISLSGFFDAERLDNGDTLIAYSDYPYPDRVIKVDPGGTYTVLVSNLNYPIDIELLSNDKILIAEYMEGRVIELDQNGNINTLIDLPFGERIADVEEKNNGNILISVTNSNERVIEIDPSGNIVQTVATGLMRPMDIEILNNGNVLITELINNRVIEIDSVGNVVWTTEGKVSLDNPFDAERLDNGNTLIADFGNNRVIEIDAAGSIIWDSSGYGLNSIQPIDVEIVR